MGRKDIDKSQKMNVGFFGFFLVVVVVFGFWVLLLFFFFGKTISFQ